MLQSSASRHSAWAARVVLGATIAACACSSAGKDNAGSPGVPVDGDGGAVAGEPGTTSPTPHPGDGENAGSGASGERVWVPASAFRDGVLSASGEGARPASRELLPLPGGGAGHPVLTSNNPEVFTGAGVLYSSAGASSQRGGRATALEGTFGIYLHHVNGATSSQSVSILIENASGGPVIVALEGSGYSQDETGGVPLGGSPPYFVSRDWVLGRPRTETGVRTLAAKEAALLWTKAAGPKRLVDGRFAVRASGPVHVHVVAASDGTRSAAEAVARAGVDAPGDYRRSGNPAPPFGREAGVYAYDTWKAAFDVEIPPGPRRVAFMVNTASGAGLTPVQAFPALAHLAESAAESVGMYGNVYDLDIGLHNDAPTRRRVRLAFHSLMTGTASRWWDGVATVDGKALDVRHVPGSPSTSLFEGTLTPGETRRVRFRAMVPGLASLPQALSVESL